MLENSYVKLKRSIWSHRWVSDPPVFVLFLYLMTCANYSEKEWKEEIISRGELVTSYSSINEVTGLSKHVTERCLKKLENTGDIIRKSTNKYTKITIVNYEEYVHFTVDEQETDEKQTENSGEENQKRKGNKKETERNPKGTTKKKKFKRNKTNNIERKLFIPPSLEQVAEYCLQRKNGMDPEPFYDYYCSNGWKIGGNEMEDWKAAVRTWERRERNDKKVSEFPDWCKNTGTKETDPKLEKEIEEELEKLKKKGVRVQNE